MPIPFIDIQKAIPRGRLVLAQLFPRVRAGISYVGRGLSYANNYIWRRPYGPEKEFVTSKTGLDGAQGTRPKLTAEAIRQWDVPELSSKRIGVRLNLHEYAMQNVIRTQPPVQIKSLTEHVLRHGAWGLGEKGASWLAGELSKDDRAREALLDAYISPAMSSFVAEGSNPGLLRNRAWTNSALVIHGKPIEAGKHLYGSLKNSALYRGRLEDMLEHARQLDAEAAHPAPAPMPVEPERPVELPAPENGRNYTINELMAFSEMFRGAQAPVTINNNPTISPVFHNNPRNYNAQQSVRGGSVGAINQGNSNRRFIGMLGIPNRASGYRHYDGRFVDEEEPQPSLPDAQKFNDLLVEYGRQNERERLRAETEYLTSPLVRRGIEDSIARKPSKAPAKAVKYPAGLANALRIAYAAHGLEGEPSKKSVSEVFELAKESPDRVTFRAQMAKHLRNAGAENSNLGHILKHTGTPYNIKQRKLLAFLDRVYTVARK